MLRDLECWGGGRESYFAYHYVKKAAIPLIITSWVLYLARPFSSHPFWGILPSALALAFAVAMTASAFKKYLKYKVIRRRTWKTFEEVEYATLPWVSLYITKDV